MKTLRIPPGASEATLRRLAKEFTADGAMVPPEITARLNAVRRKGNFESTATIAMRMGLTHLDSAA